MTRRSRRPIARPGLRHSRVRWQRASTYFSCDTILQRRAVRIDTASVDGSRVRLPADIGVRLERQFADRQSNAASGREFRWHADGHDKALNGFSDWGNIRLDQIGAGRNLLRLSNGDNDVGDNDVGNNDVGDNDVGDNDVGDNDAGDNDVGDNDVGDNDVGATEPDFESTKAPGRTPPYALDACILGVDCTGPKVQPSTRCIKIRARMQPTAFGHLVQSDCELRGDRRTRRFRRCPLG